MSAELRGIRWGMPVDLNSVTVMLRAEEGGRWDVPLP